MLISVVIPHLNQEEYLRDGLAALHRQDDVESNIEIIVVDNGSRRLPEEICAAWPDVELASEPTPGPGPARNTGAALAQGDILAFIDADCRAHPRWLASVEAAFTATETHIIGGDVQVDYRDPEHPTFLEPYEAIYSYRNNEHIAEGFSGTGNLATRPHVLADVGPFAGIDLAEDRDWGIRAGISGYRIDYVPEMIVYHPARRTFAELRQKWDRHIAHDWDERRKGRWARTKWLARALAVAGSPVFEISTVLSSNRVSGSNERLLAFLCLCRVRLYRGVRMASMAIVPNRPNRARGWNRKA